jgi:hypothetical protein
MAACKVSVGNGSTRGGELALPVKRVPARRSALGGDVPAL